MVRHLLVTQHVGDPRLDGRDTVLEVGREGGDGVGLERRLLVQLDGDVSVVAERRLADGADRRLTRLLRAVQAQRLPVIAAHQRLEALLLGVDEEEFFIRPNIFKYNNTNET